MALVPHTKNSLCGEQGLSVVTKMVEATAKNEERLKHDRDKHRLQEKTIYQGILDTQKQKGTQFATPLSLPHLGAKTLPAQKITPAMSVGVTEWCPEVSPIAAEAWSNLSEAIRNALLSDWRSMNAVMKDEESQEYNPEVKKRHCCFYAGFCLCHLPKLRSYVAKLQCVLRSAFRKGTDLQRILLNGLAFLHVYSSRPSAASQPIDIWLHLSHIDRTTWRGGIRKMQRDPDELRQLQAEALGHVAVIGVEDAYDGIAQWWSHFRGIDFKQAQKVDVWTPTIYACSQREVGQPLSHQILEAVFPVESWEFWDGTPIGKSRQPPGVQALRDKVPVEAIQDIAPAVPALQDMHDPAGSDMEQPASEHGSDSSIN